MFIYAYCRVVLGLIYILGYLIPCENPNDCSSTTFSYKMYGMFIAIGGGVANVFNYFFIYFTVFNQFNFVVQS